MTTTDVSQLVRLEIERPPDVGELVNLVQNPDGNLGAWAWVTPVAGSVLRGGSGLTYTSPGGVASYFYTEPLPVTVGDYVAASWTATPVFGTYTALVQWLASDRVTVLSSTAATSALGGSATRVSIGSFVVPAGAVYCRLRFNHLAAGGGNPAAGTTVTVREVTLTEATTSAGISWTRTNLLPTPSGETGVGGWHSSTAKVGTSSAQALVGTKSLTLTKTGGDGAGAMTSAAMTVTPGRDYAFQARMRAAGTTRKVTIAARWFKANGDTIIITKVKKRTETAGAWSAVTGGVVTAPSNAATVRMRVEYPNLANGEVHYVDAAMVEKAATVGAYFDGDSAPVAGATHAWVGTAHASASTEVGPANDPGTLVPVAYQNILGPTAEINIDREDLNVGSMSARLFDAILDPTQDELISTGKRIRLVTVDGEVIYAGKVLTASVTYHLLASDEQKRAEVTLSAVDAIGTLASSPRREGVATIDELPYVLEGAGTPWSCNGSGDQVPTATVVAYNDNASALDQVAVTRDSGLGFAWVDRNGVLQAWDRTLISSTVAASLDETTYTADLNVDLDLAAIINTVTVRVLSVIATSGVTEEVVFGPYIDTASFTRYGEHSAEYVVQGFAVTDTAGILAYANQILAASATPRMRANTVVLPITMAEEVPRALLDLYDLVHVTNTRALLDEYARVRSVQHAITPGRWAVTLGFTGDNGVAPSTSVPAPPPGVGDVKTEIDATTDQLNADLTELNTVTLPQVQADLADNATQIGTLNGLFPITSTSITDGAITTPKMTANSINGDRIIANTLNANKIVANSITGDKIAANTISADKLVANSITASQLTATAINGMTIVGATVVAGASATSGERIILRQDGSGGILESYSGLTGESPGYFNPSILFSRPALTIAPGTTATYTAQPKIEMYSSTPGNGACNTTAENIQLAGGTSVRLVSSSGMIALDSPQVTVGGPLTSQGFTSYGEAHGSTLWSDSPSSTAQPTANVYMTAGGQLQIMTSTEAAKTNIRLAAIDVDAALQLEPKVYQSLCEADDPDADIFGFSAQQAQSLGLDEWVVYEADGETVQGFSYTGWVVALQATNRRQQTQIDALTRRLDALEAAQ